MRAIVYHKYGTPDVLELKEVDKPVPKDDEVLIKVHAVSINDWDLGLLEGDPINRMLNGLRKRNYSLSGTAGRQVGRLFCKIESDRPCPDAGRNR